MEKYTTTQAAAALYCGGWRAKDRDQLKAEYDLTDYEVDEICKVRAEIDAE